MAAEIIGITAGVGSILKVIGGTGILIHGIANAPHEAKHISNQLDATKATLSSFKASLRTVSPSQAFLDIWSGTTRTVLNNIKFTIDELNVKLGGSARDSGRRLNFWKRTKWPFQREEALMLQSQLQGYMQSLAMIHNALLQGTAHVAQQAVEGVDEIMSAVGTHPLSVSPSDHPFMTSGVSASKVSRPSSVFSDQNSTIVASDSVSQVGLETDREEATHVRSDKPAAGPRFRIEDAEPSQMVDTFKNAEVYIVTGKIDITQRESLGTGTLSIALSKEKDLLWIVFHPKGSKTFESRWYMSEKDVQNTLLDHESFASLARRLDGNGNTPNLRNLFRSGAVAGYPRSILLLNAHADIHDKHLGVKTGEKVWIETAFDSAPRDNNERHNIVFNCMKEALNKIVKAKLANAEAAKAAKHAAQTKAAAMKSALRMAQR